MPASPWRLAPAHASALRPPRARAPAAPCCVRPRAAPRRAPRGARAGGDGRRRSAARAKRADPEPERDEDGTYIGTYSNFWSDFSQIRGVVIFSGLLAAFFVGGQVAAGLLLPLLMGEAGTFDFSRFASAEYWTQF